MLVRLRTLWRFGRLFRRRAFLPESELLDRVAVRVRRVRVAWLGVLVLSILLHLVLVPFLLSDKLFQRPPAEEYGPLTLRLRQPPARPQPARPALPVPPEPPPPAPAAPESASPSARPGLPDEPVRADPSPSNEFPVLGVGEGPSSRPSGGQGGTGTGGGGGHGRALEQFGGSEETEAAVRRGLEWLADHQSSDGRWDSDGFSKDRACACDGEGNPQYDAGCTALALAAFLAFDEAAPRPPGRDVVESAIRFLLGIQTPRGSFGPEEGSFMYNQAIALYALAHAHMLRPSPEAARALERGLEFIARAQQASGGWDYTSDLSGRNDLSITGWQILAIDACGRAGFQFPADRLARARDFVARMVKPEAGTAIYADSRIGAGEQRRGLLPVALLGLVLCGDPVRAPGILRLGDAVVRLRPDANARAAWKDTGQSAYYWYYGTLALFHLGGAWWREWNPAMKDALLALQRTDGHEAGSWDPDPNWIGQVGGRVYATAIAVLTLEVYYRVVPKHLEVDAGAREYEPFGSRPLAGDREGA